MDLCWSDPGFDVDLYVSTDLRTMTAIWMGLTTVKKEREKLDLAGDRRIAEKMQSWLGLSPFAIEPKRISASARRKRWLALSRRRPRFPAERRALAGQAAVIAGGVTAPADDAVARHHERIGFLPTAAPTARAAFGSPIFAAMPE